MTMKASDHTDKFVNVCCSSPTEFEADDATEADVATTENSHNNEKRLDYGIEDTPAFYLCIIFGLQQVLLAISSTISIPLIVGKQICAEELELVKSQIMSTFLFMCGICTILQDTFGVRLPIIQGGCHKFIPAITALMALDKWKCPSQSVIHNALTGNLTLNGTSGNFTELDVTEMWQSRMREIQGGIIVASVTQVLIGCTGILGVLLQYIGPITVVPTITLVGLSLIDVALNFCKIHWGVSILTIFFLLLFSLYLRNISCPIPSWTTKKKCFISHFPVFRLFPVILAVILSWSITAILTECDVFTSNSTLPEYKARTDARLHVVSNAKWFFFPYPGQWGLPTLSVASYMAMMAATFTSIIESVGDYYACARISGAPPPPAHAINRGIAMEGFGSILSGAVGSGGATTSYSQNVGAIGFTKNASRRVFQYAGIIFLICGLFGKVGAVLTLLPDPILGGTVVLSFGMVTSVGLSTLQFVDLSSGRNLCIIGSSLLIGLMVPRYIEENANVIDTGNSELDQVLTVLLSTAMFVGGMIGFILDNTVPGTDEERGIIKWRNQLSTTGASDDTTYKSTYDLPFIMPFLRRYKCFSYIPFLPTFKYESQSIFRKCCKSKKQKINIDEIQKEKYIGIPNSNCKADIEIQSKM
ncbi:solute carrier family 23 member 1-like [Mytilus trossulus]|uniref:solute carrier family 23 member 1-like n=1 Tax=Mytilus trossulus TaxID=6551 RepID=UPI0030061B75